MEHDSARSSRLVSDGRGSTTSPADSEQISANTIRALYATSAASARLRCEDPDCGIKGENPNIRFGRWVSTNFGETKRSQRIYEARRLWEVFGERRGPCRDAPIQGIFRRLEMPLDLADLFACPRHPGGLRLLPTACAAMWRGGKAAEPWDRLFPCRGCAIGATHAGETPNLAPCDDGRKCCFCGRTDQRLVCRTICVSCANRLFELLRGRYRRDAPPGLGARLRCFTVHIEEELPP
jgi:hypothetical protein